MLGVTAELSRKDRACRQRAICVSEGRPRNDRGTPCGPLAQVHAGIFAAEPVSDAGRAGRCARRRYSHRSSSENRDHSRGSRAPAGQRGMNAPRYRKATDVVQLGRDPRQYLGAVNTPVFRATTILFPTVADLENAALGRYKGLSYGLHGLPTVTDFQNAMAALEGGFAALAVPSGLTATTLPFLALTKPGDHVLVTDVVYGPTRRFCENHLKRLGVDVSYYDPVAGAAIEREFRSNTRIVFAESPGSLTFDMQDVPAIAAVAHARGA